MFLRQFVSSLLDLGDPLSSDLTSCFRPLATGGADGGKFSEKDSENLDSLSWLYNVAPCFPVCGDRIEVIHEPQQFYETLIQKMASAKERIVLASLYLGTGPLENNIIQVLRKSLKRQPNLRVSLLLDFTRGTRGEVNSKTLLQPLLSEFGEQVQLSLYHTPNLRGLTRRFIPPRWNELLGLQHMKVYLFDDTVLISGANLSNDYFTNRQDRYILIEDKALADFYTEFVSRVQDFSLAVRKNSVGLHSNWTQLPYEGLKKDFIRKAKRRIFDFMIDVYRQQQLKLLNTTKEVDSWIFPLIEMGQIGIHHDSIVTKRFLSTCVKGSRLELATGYFNLTEDYMASLTHDCLAQCRILMAHPNANGFQGAKGPAGSIPAAYTLIARNFYEMLCRRRQDYRVSLYEYEKTNWTYHAKGMWYYLPSSTLPSLILIGSSNFGERSVNRDLESQVCLVTTNRRLRERLHKENELLFNQSSTAERQITTRSIPRWVRAVVQIFRNFF